MPYTIAMNGVHRPEISGTPGTSLPAVFPFKVADVIGGAVETIPARADENEVLGPARLWRGLKRIVLRIEVELLRIDQRVGLARLVGNSKRNQRVIVHEIVDVVRVARLVRTP